MKFSKLKSFLCAFSWCLLLCAPDIHAATTTCGSDCVETPNCIVLGYSLNPSCDGEKLVCPFDSNYQWCKKYTCADGRYATENNADKTCHAVTFHGLSCYDCNCSDYPNTSCPDHAQCSTCTSKGAIYYNITSCDKGYRLSTAIGEDDQKKQLCLSSGSRMCLTSYDLSECPQGAVCSSCTPSRGKTVYRINSCKAGYKISRTLGSGSSAASSIITTCRRACANGYTLTNDECVPKTCNEDCHDDAAACGTTGDRGWELGELCNYAGTSACRQCVAKKCDASYRHSLLPIGASSTLTCYEGDQIKYAVQSCQDGYTLVNGSCYKKEIIVLGE